MNRFDSGNKKKCFSTIKTVIFVTVLMFSHGCAGKAYREAIKKDTVPSYELFLERYPGNKYVPKVEERIEQLYFVETVMNKTMQSYNMFLERYPHGGHSDFIKTLKTIEEVNEIEPTNSCRTIDLEDVNRKEDQVDLLMRNKTGIPIQLIIIGAKIRRIALRSNEEKMLKIMKSSQLPRLFVKDDQRKFKPCQYLITLNEKRIIDLILLPKMTYSKVLVLQGGK